jgi:hypothetical protein
LLQEESNNFRESAVSKSKKSSVALFPFQTSVLDYKIGDHVKKLTRNNESNIVGVVTHILPKSCKIRVQWTYGNELESPEEIYKVSPTLYPTSVGFDTSYDSWENRDSEKNYGTSLPKRPKKYLESLADKIASRHVNATSVLVENILSMKQANLNELQCYLKMTSKYAKSVGDSLLKELVLSVYEE